VIVMAKEKKQPQLEELRAQLQRALADYANLSRRVEEEKKAVIRFANVVLIAKFLGVLDSLEAAQKIIGSEGLELVVQKFRGVVESEGVKEITVKPGEAFNPNYHEAVETVVGAEDGKVVEVVEKGYGLEGKVIRPARVKVSKKIEPASTQKEQVNG